MPIETHVIPCGSCGNDLETARAEWCHCVAKRVSVICPHCSQCVCKWPAAARCGFWLDAPAWLLQRGTAEQERRLAARAADAVEAVDILIVDDDEEIRLLAAYNVEQMGYRAATIGNPSEALDAVELLRPRIVLTDALMPKMDGRELCRLIKSAHPEIAVLVMTSLYTGARYRYEAYKVFRADEYLPKPIDFEQLRTVLRKFDAPARREIA